MLQITQEGAIVSDHEVKYTRAGYTVNFNIWSVFFSVYPDFLHR
jgi:hypothetical protein